MSRILTYPNRDIGLRKPGSWFVPKSTAKKIEGKKIKKKLSRLLDSMPAACFTLMWQLPQPQFFDLFGPSDQPIVPDLLCWWALDVRAYDNAPTAVNFRQTRQTVDPGCQWVLDSSDTNCYVNKILGNIVGQWK